MEAKEATDFLRAELSNELERYQSRRSYGYFSITVLILLWEDDDLNCMKEVKLLSAMFKDRFHYEVRQFLIPSERPQDSLNRAISDFVYTFGAKDNLLLVYYAGHGDPDLEGDREAVWAALKTGGPTLQWHFIQPTLEAAECDVVIMLDCCYAGQAARARSAHNVELLAATAMGLRTPGVGQKYPSFTQGLISEMIVLLEEYKSFSITTLHRQMSKKHVGLRQQPVYVALSESSRGSVILQKHGSDSLTYSQSSQQEAPLSLSLKVSLFDKPTKAQKNNILRWMTTSSPSTISAITVENVFFKAEKMRSLGETLLQRAPIKTNILKGLSDGANNEIKHKFDELSEVLNTLIPNHSLGETQVTGIVHDTQKKSEGFLSSIEGCISALDTLSLQELANQDEAKDSGITESIKMRLVLLDDNSVLDQRFQGKIKFLDGPKAKERFRIGDYGNMSLLVEYWYYDSEKGVLDSAPMATVLQVKKVSALHRLLKGIIFRTLRGQGYVHEHLHGPRFGMVYQIPYERKDHPFFLLSDLFKNVPAVPLGTRVQMALAICRAVLYLHAVGWLHKGVKSENILIFSKYASTLANQSSLKYSAVDVDFENPYLLGFDYSRPEAAESWLVMDFDTGKNLYRHPDRWGRPVTFKKKHDIYSLGILLLEVGLWRPITSLDPEKKSFRKITNPEHLRETFLDLASSRLAHAVGYTYTEATQLCLTRDLYDGMEDWEIQKLFQEDIVNKLSAKYQGL